MKAYTSVWVLSQVLGLGLLAVGCQQPVVEVTSDGGENDAGPMPSPTPSPAPDLQSLIRPTSTTVGTDLLRCVELKALDSKGVVVALPVDAAGLEVEVEPPEFVVRGAQDDCPPNLLPIIGVQPGSGVIRLRFSNGDHVSSVEATVRAVATSGQLAGVANAVVPVGQTQVLRWGFAPTGGQADGLGKLALRFLKTRWSNPAIGSLSTNSGAIELRALGRGSSTVEVSYQGATLSTSPQNITVQAVAGTFKEISYLMSAEPKAASVGRPQGSQMKVGECFSLTARAQFVDGSTSYSDVWPEAPFEVMTPLTLRREGPATFCGVAEGEGIVRVCGGGRCLSFAVFIGTVSSVEIEVGSGEVVLSVVSTLLCRPAPVKVFATSAGQRREVTQSPALEFFFIYLPQTQLDVSVALDRETGGYVFVDGKPCLNLIGVPPAAGSTGEGKPAVRYGGVTATATQPIRVRWE